MGAVAGVTLRSPGGLGPGAGAEGGAGALRAGVAARGYCRGMRISGVLIDIDGVLTVSWQPLPGAVAALRPSARRACRWPWSPAPPPGRGPRSRRSWPGRVPGHRRRYSHRACHRRRLPQRPPPRCPVPAAQQRRHRRGPGGRWTRPVGDPAPVEVVLVGGAGPEFSYQALNRAFGCLRGGAGLVAMHRGLYWRTSKGLQLDSGALSSPGSNSWQASRPRWWASPPRRSSPPR